MGWPRRANFVWGAGTSYAAPTVAGIIALLLTVRQDVIDFHQLFASLGCTDVDPVADHLEVSKSSGGTNVVVDPHNGQASMTVADIIGVPPTALHEAFTTSFDKIA